MEPRTWWFIFLSITILVIHSLAAKRAEKEYWSNKKIWKLAITSWILILINFLVAII